MTEVKVKVKAKTQPIKKKPIKAGSTDKSNGLVPTQAIIKLRTKILKKSK